MTKKQVRKLSLEYSNMAPYQKFSFNVKRKHKTVLLLALKEFKPCLLVYMYKPSLQESSSTDCSWGGMRAESGQEVEYYIFHTFVLHEHTAYPEN